MGLLLLEFALLEVPFEEWLDAPLKLKEKLEFPYCTNDNNHLNKLKHKQDNRRRSSVGSGIFDKNFNSNEKNEEIIFPEKKKAN